MTISLERARELLGEEARDLSDESIARVCRELDDYARLLLRIDARRQGELQQEGAPAPAQASPGEEPRSEAAPTKGDKPASAAPRPHARGRAGHRWKVTPTLERQVREMRAAGATIGAIASEVKLNRTTVDKILRAVELAPRLCLAAIVLP